MALVHVRVISPAEYTKTVVERLRAEPGAVHLVVFPGAATDPDGDVVEVDVAREAADDVLEAIDADNLARFGCVTITDAGTTLSERAARAEEDAPGEGSDAVVWDELIARTGDESQLNGTYLAFLSIACLLAAVGVVTDSPVTIVGAMVVGPEFGPLAAIAVGLVRRRWHLVRSAVLALAVGFPAAMLVTAVATFGAETFGLMDTTSLRADGQVSFIYQVGWASLVVSLLAGAAGMLSLTSAKSAALVGVFISVTTVPAAGYAVVAATLGDWGRCASSSVQLLVNLTGIVLAGAAVLLVRTRVLRQDDRASAAVQRQG